MQKTEISNVAFRRIPVYLNFLKTLPPETENISATKIAQVLGFGEVQVRKDLGVLCGGGRPKIGYSVRALICGLEQMLTCDCSAVIIGAGRLGKALLDSGGFSDYGLRILAAFDFRVSVPVCSEQQKPIFPLSELPLFCSRYQPKIGIIAVPESAAQESCDRLAENGVKAIWNFSPCSLRASPDLLIQSENLPLSLAYLKLKMIRSFDN